MQLPNPDRVFIDDAKVRDYLLSPSHPVGRFKSVFFATLGFTRANWQLLRDALLQLSLSDAAERGQPSPFGQKFEIRATLQGPSGRRAVVVTVWLVSNLENFARFVTAFPG